MPTLNIVQAELDLIFSVITKKYDIISYKLKGKR